MGGREMGIYNTTKNDYKVVDGTQTVTLTTKPAGTTTVVTMADSLVYQLDEIANSEGFLQFGDQSWSLADVQLVTATRPKPGDTIMDSDGVVWEIRSAQQDGLGVCWDCSCRKTR